MKPFVALYLIEILHQTTTETSGVPAEPGCILSKFYIKPQRCQDPEWCPPCCILSKFYIKPQLGVGPQRSAPCCILSKFYIKPQRQSSKASHSRSCILSKFYIKPQLCAIHEVSLPVVSYRNSTSNHNSNSSCQKLLGLYLIEILHQTTTRTLSKRSSGWLYLIEILHQTTTLNEKQPSAHMLYLIEILHQTTTTRVST